MQNYDEKIDWAGFYTSRIVNGAVKGDEVIGLCPFHEDKDPSFNANVQTGVWKCHGCDRRGNGQTFLQEHENMSAEDALELLHGLAGIKKKRKSYTVDDYAKAKKLPVSFLKDLGVVNGKTGISIPYYAEDGSVISRRQRYGDTGSGPRFTWSKGSKVNLYGLWRLPQIRKEGYVILVEGESDCHTLWFHGFPALGAPGATVFQEGWVNLLHKLDVYVFQEPDVSGETFVRKVSEALVRREWRGKVYRLNLIDAKDPSELHCKSPEKFEEYWRSVIEQAEEVDFHQAAGKPEDVIPDAPVQLRQPPNWRFRADGIFMIHEKTGLPVCISRIPILLSRRIKSIETGMERIEICYRRDNQWHHAIFNRSTLFQSRTITQLSDLGITVTSENSKSLVKFLFDLEAENIDLLDRAECVEQLGWHGKRFVPGDKDLVVDVDMSMRRYLDAYYPEGTMDDWLTTIRPHRKNLLFRFILAAAVAAPLLRLIKHRIFLIHIWGETRIGKTAALKAALSAWGDPDRLIASFYATQVGLERLAGFFRDLPLGVDEKQVDTKLFSENLTYMLSMGAGKVRGTKTGGIQPAQTWRTIVITTGEEPLSAVSSHSGMYSRLLEIYGHLFENETEARQLHNVTSFGHAGPAFIQHVMKTPVNEIQERYEKFDKQFNKWLGGGKHQPQHISAVAVVAMADSYLSQWLFEENEETAEGKALDMGVEVIKTLHTARETMDMVKQAYDFIQQWLASNSEQFGPDARNPRFGAVDRDDPDRVYVYPYILRKALKDENFNDQSVLQGLMKRGLLPGVKDTPSVVRKIEGRSVRVIPFDVEPKQEEEAESRWWND